MSLLFFIFCPKCNKCPAEGLQTRKTERIIYISMHTKVFFATSPLQTPATYAPENLQKNINGCDSRGLQIFQQLLPLSLFHFKTPLEFARVQN